MRVIEQLLAGGGFSYTVVKAQPVGPRKLFVAVEAYVHATKAAATCVLSVDLDSLATEVVCEFDGSAVDYLHVDGWHGLVRLDAVVEFDGKLTITPSGMGEPNSFGNKLVAIARVGERTIVCGTDQKPDHVLDGFVATVANGTLTRTLLSSSYTGGFWGGPLDALAVRGEQVYVAGGVQDPNSKYLLLAGDRAVPVGDLAILALHVRADGAVMIGGDTAAWIYDGTKVTKLPSITMQVAGAVEFGGAEYWLAHDKSEAMVLWKRTGDKPVKAFKAKYQSVGYREAADVWMTASDELLVVSNKERIHIFDGKTWSQIALQANVKKPFKRLPVGMKK